jgi:probable 2-oxoglutarate dehydrogenase E1 component DHKTD1
MYTVNIIAISTEQQMYIGELGKFQDAEEVEWFAQQMEQSAVEELDHDTRRNLAKEMLKSQAFDNFLATKFVTVKRYGGEGAESMMGFFMEFFNASANGTYKILICELL